MGELSSSGWLERSTAVQHVLVRHHTKYLLPTGRPFRYSESVTTSHTGEIMAELLDIKLATISLDLVRRGHRFELEGELLV